MGVNTSSPETGPRCLVGGDDLVESGCSDRGTLVPPVGDVGKQCTITNTGKNYQLPSSNISCAAIPDLNVIPEPTHHPVSHPPPPKRPLVDKLHPVEEDILASQTALIEKDETVREGGQGIDTDKVLGGGMTTADCTHTEDGWCTVHGQAKKKFRPKKIWAKGRTGLFGWRTGRVTYWTCLEKTPISAGTPTFLMLRGSAGYPKKKALQTTSTEGQCGETNPNKRKQLLQLLHYRPRLGD